MASFSLMEPVHFLKIRRSSGWPKRMTLKNPWTHVQENCLGREADLGAITCPAQSACPVNVVRYVQVNIRERDNALKCYPVTSNFQS